MPAELAWRGPVRHRLRQVRDERRAVAQRRVLHQPGSARLALRRLDARWVQDAAAASNAEAAEQCDPLPPGRPCPLLAQPPRAAWRYGCDTECLPTSTGVLSCAAYDQVTLRALGARPGRA